MHMCVYPVHTHKQIAFCIIYLLCIIYYCVSYTGILHSVIIRYTSSSIFLYAIKCSEIFEPFFSLHLSVHFSVCVCLHLWNTPVIVRQCCCNLRIWAYVIIYYISRVVSVHVSVHVMCVCATSSVHLIYVCSMSVP